MNSYIYDYNNSQKYKCNIIMVNQFFHFMQITNIGILDKIYISVLSLLYLQTLTHRKNETFWINGNTRITTQIILARWPHLMIILVPVSPRLIWRSDEIPKFYTYKAFSRYKAFSENMIRLWCKLLTGKKNTPNTPPPYLS